MILEPTSPKNTTATTFLAQHLNDTYSTYHYNTTLDITTEFPTTTLPDCQYTKDEWKITAFRITAFPITLRTYIQQHLA